MRISTISALFAIFFIVTSVIAGEIHDAVQKADLAKLKALLEKNPELVNAKDESGKTPLHWAARATPLNVELMKLLIEKGAAVNAQDVNQSTPFHLVAQQGHIEAAELLLAHGAEMNVKNLFGNTPLRYAMLYQRHEMLEFLIEKSVALPEPGEEGSTMLHDAASGGFSELVAALMSKGIDLNSKNGNGGTLLYSAVTGGLLDLAKTLIAQRANLNEKDRYGWTPLHLAARKGNHNIVQLLIASGADMNARNVAGETPLQVAVEYKQDDIVALLKAKDADQQPPAFPALKGKYLGEKNPGTAPKLFGLGVVSTINYDHSSPAFSADGNEVFLTYDLRPYESGAIIKFMRRENDQWTAPQWAAFLGQHDNMYPTFSSDDQKLYYSSDRPIRTGEEVKERGIWFVEGEAQGWSAPQYIGFDSLDIYALSVTKNGNLYFMAQQRDNQGLYDLYYSRFVDGGYTPPEKLAAPINTPHYEDCPYVSPDERYMIFESNRPGGFGGTDLYFSDRRVDGSWSEPRNLGAAINTSFSERFAQISRDGKHFFFGSNRNGNFDIYWVEVRVIDDLRFKD